MYRKSIFKVSRSFCLSICVRSNVIFQQDLSTACCVDGITECVPCHVICGRRCAILEVGMESSFKFRSIHDSEDRLEAVVKVGCCVFPGSLSARLLATGAIGQATEFPSSIPRWSEFLRGRAEVGSSCPFSDPSDARFRACRQPGPGAYNAILCQLIAYTRNTGRFGPMSKISRQYHAGLQAVPLWKFTTHHDVPIS